MKRVLLFLNYVAIALTLLSCGVAKERAISSRMIKSPSEQATILLNNYPQLYEYYTEGVLNLYSMREMQYADGRKDWKLGYIFKHYTISDYGEKMQILKSHFPEIYNLFTQGKATIDELYKFVGKDGKIKYNVSWRHVPIGAY